MKKRVLLDSTNRFLIHELQKNGRVTFTYLAKKLKITPAAVKERIERLIDRGIIKVTTLVNCESLTFYYPISATIGIEADSECISMLIKKFSNCPLAINLQKTSGNHNLIITMVARDLESLEKRVNEHIRSEPGIKHVEINVGRNLKQFVEIKVNYPVARKIAPCGVEKDDESRCRDCLAFISEK